MEFGLHTKLKKEGGGVALESKPAYTDEQLAADPDNEYKRNISSQVTIYNFDIKQQGEGIRTETNPIIKKMFLQNRYFRYDGNGNTAEIVTALRRKLLSDLKSEAGGKDGIKYGPLNEYYAYYASNSDKEPTTTDVTDRHYKASELGFKVKKGEPEKEYYVKDYSGEVILNQDALNAFTMLENTHTLDADYIYRDFKELVVELGYFEKEELTDEIPRLLEWIIPDAPSVDYPDRVLDKKENEYGTMIHSRGDIIASEKEDLLTLETEETKKIEYKYNFDPRELYTMYSYGTILIDGITPEIFLEKADSIWNDMCSAGGYGYCTNQNPCTTHTGKCGLANSFAESRTPYNIDYDSNGNVINYAQYNVSRPTFVSWVLIALETRFENFCTIQTKADNGNTITVMDIHNSATVARTCIEKYNGEIITDFDMLRPGDIIAYIDKDAENVTAVDIIGKKEGNKFLRYGVENSVGQSDKPKIDFGESEFYNTQKYKCCFGIRLFGKDKYVGYEGNEMVVSPVTGILLEYGTYDGTQVDSITGEEYRVNVDLKYGSLQDSPDENQNQNQNRNQNQNQNRDENSKGKTVSDKVGYAKILVLNSEYYKYLEQYTENRWKKSNESLVTTNNTFKEVLVDDKASTTEIDNHKKDMNNDTYSALNKLRSYDPNVKWSDLDQTVYGYKEFAESYETAGIAGYIIYIDGFICEKPDTTLKDVATEIPYNGNPKEEYKLTMDSYKKVTPTNYMTEIEYLDGSMKPFLDGSIQLESKYIEDRNYNTASLSASNKLKAEAMVKCKASSSMYIENVKKEDGKNEDIIFIKEGTILGRTMTDKELIESPKLRNNQYEKYEEVRQRTDEGTGKVIGENKIIGNYIRIIMRDQDKTPVENVENYMKLDVEKEFDWIGLYFWGPFESGGVNIDLCGPESISSCSPGEVAVGILQETDLVYPYHNYKPGSAISKFLRNCSAMDPVLCAPLSGFFTKDGVDYWGIVDENFGPHYGRYFNQNGGKTEYKPGSNSGTQYVVSGGSLVSMAEFKRLLNNRDPDIENYEHDVVTIDGTKYYDFVIVYDNGDGYSDGVYRVKEDGSMDGNCGESGPYYKLWLDDGKIGFFKGRPQRKVIYDNYTDGSFKQKVDEKLQKSDLQDALTAVANTNREKFIRIQMEVGKEEYLDEIIADIGEIVGDKYWFTERSAYAQGAIMHVLVGGSEQYLKEIKKFLNDEGHTVDELTDEVLVRIARVCWGDFRTTKMTQEQYDKHKGVTDKGRAYCEPEIALAALDGRLTVFDVEDWVRYGGYCPYGFKILDVNGIDSNRLKASLGY